MSKSKPVVGVDIDYDKMVRVLEASNLAEEDKQTFLALLKTSAAMMRELQRKGASIARLKKMLFGPSSEKASRLFPPATSDASESQSGDSCETHGQEATIDIESGKDAAGKADDAVSLDAKRNQARGHGRNASTAYTGATHIAVPLHSIAIGAPCPLCKAGHVYPFDIQPIVRVHGGPAIRADVLDVAQARCGTCGEIFTAELPDEAGTQKYDHGARAILPILKYSAGIPFFRLEKLQNLFGVPLPASVQWEICEQTAKTVAFVYLELLTQAAQARVMHNDDTGAQILGPVVRHDRAPSSPTVRLVLPQGTRPDDRTGTFTSAIVTTTANQRIAVFMTGWKHCGENLETVLSERDASLPPAIQMCDALSRNAPENFETILANCLAHGRRHFTDIAEQFKGPCKHVIDELAIVFHQQAITKAMKLSDQERLVWHQKHSAPVMLRLAEWMKTEINEKRIEPNSSLGDAIKYMEKHWNELTAFLRVAGAPLENNICEMALKIAIMNRKNAYFFRTERGASVADIFMTVIYTTRLAGKNPFEYLLALLDHKNLVAANPRDWLPWNYQETLAALSADRRAA